MRTGEVRYEAFQMSEMALGGKVYDTVHWCIYDWKEKQKWNNAWVRSRCIPDQCHATATFLFKEEEL
jgi:hypothetical protein